jgi:hypothetical protein
MEEKYILDATAGFRMMWFDKHDPNTLYIDKRPECEPDQVANFTKLPYPDRKFKLIIFDPPHIIQKATENPSGMSNRFGYLQPETWQSDIQNGFTELWRLLDDYGILLFKWANTHASSDKLLELLPIKPLVYQITAKEARKWRNNSRSNRDADKVRTLWFCFMKKPQSDAIKQTEVSK